ncbi:MAG: helix-turn-helix domain-containing protein [Anaerolineales bacterium]|nr:helix-turn-helix domain-containing protein [Anaerolineales bacterium]
MTEDKGRVGSSFEDYLREEGTLEDVKTLAVKRVLSWQLKKAMEEQRVSKNQMAKAMKTSRSQLDRILDPENDRVQLATLVSAARVLGRELRIDLV